MLSALQLFDCRRVGWCMNRSAGLHSPAKNILLTGRPEQLAPFPSIQFDLTTVLVHGLEGRSLCSQNGLTRMKKKWSSK